MGLVKCCILAGDDEACAACYYAYFLHLPTWTEITSVNNIITPLPLLACYSNK